MSAVATRRRCKYSRSADKAKQNGLATDLFLTNTVTHENRVWLMNGTTQLSEQTFNPATAASATQQIAGVDDFDGDQRNDLVFWNSATGAVEFWLMNGVNRIGAPVPPSAAWTLAPSWKLSATADFNANGKPDIVWRNFTPQKIVIWTMNGTAKVGNIIPTPDQAVSFNWEIVGAFDMNGDGTTDFLWYNSTSGKLVYWWMNAAVQRITGNFTNPPNAGANNWKVLAAGDYGVGTGGVAGTADVVWRNASSAATWSGTWTWLATGPSGPSRRPTSRPRTRWTGPSPGRARTNRRAEAQLPPAYRAAGCAPRTRTDKANQPMPGSGHPSMAVATLVDVAGAKGSSLFEDVIAGRAPGVLP